MVGLSSYWDKMINGVANDEDFEKILYLLDFPMESIEGDVLDGDWNPSNSECFVPIPSEALMGLGLPLTPGSKIGNATSYSRPKSDRSLDVNGTSKQKPITCVEDASSSIILRQDAPGDMQESRIFQTKSPVSVLERGQSSFTRSLIIKSGIDVPVRPRSKRRRATAPWSLIPPMSSFYACNWKQNSLKDREKKKKSLLLSARTETTYKKCTHCQVTKTPQWREGPLGPRTLCNACGVRYRSGRLFPEYRPAASPTFVPYLHSNSHKKVIEMRNKGKQPAIEVEDLHYLHSSSSFL